jgi:2-octaprenyl-6-methoxyphenol hydroxylase
LTLQPNQEFDVVIVGGGLVGASLAVALSPADLKILVVEPVALNSDQQPSYEERTVALTYSARLVFGAMGIWKDIESLEAEPILDVHVSNKGHFGQTHLSCNHVGTDALGYVVPTRVIGQVLWDTMERQDGLTLLCPAQATGIEQDDKSCSVTIEQVNAKARVNAPMVVLADGGRSGLGEKLALSAKYEEYGQSAILCIITADRPHNGQAYERFTDQGPLALLPHSTVNGQCRYAVVWTTRNDEVESRMNLEDEMFTEKLQHEFGDRAGIFSNPSPRKCYPLKRSLLDKPVDGRVMVVGNAAHTVHPVAGQGFNLGLRDVAALAESTFKTPVTELGDRTMLDTYVASRRREAKMVNYFTHSLIQVFSNDILPISMARNLGLQAVEYLPPVKRFLLKRTMGLSGKQPRMALGLPLGQ